MVAQRVGELATNADHRIERIHCALSNQRDRREAQAAHCLLRQRE